MLLISEWFLISRILIGLQFQKYIKREIIKCYDYRFQMVLDKHFSNPRTKDRAELFRFVQIEWIYSKNVREYFSIFNGGSNFLNKK